jgi:hypothetical protein
MNKLQTEQTRGRFLELPMDVEMGRVPYYHRIYVNCWSGIKSNS